MKLNSFKELFLVLLSDVYGIENIIVAELPAIIKKVDSEDLKTALQNHLIEAKTQLKRCEKIFKLMGESPFTVPWGKDQKSFYASYERFLKDNPSSPLADAATIAFLQRIEHAQIATYGTLCEYANVLDNSEIKSLVKETLKEEVKADATLSKLAEGGMFATGINVAATKNV